MDTDKAYLLGLIIGGGIFGNAEDVFKIRLPYHKWGSYAAHPERAGEIANDILRKVGQLFRVIYNVSVQYRTDKEGTWSILCEGDVSPIIEDLSYYEIRAEGEIRSSASIDKIIPDLCDDNLRRRFIAGLADTIGSTAKSHRRFTAEHQILSFEINGFNYKFVCDLCKLLYSVNCIPDQVNWNHPNIHCASDPYNEQWRKGFKLRVLLDQYEKFGAFVFGSKTQSMNENRQLQSKRHKAEKCETRRISITPSSVHPAETDSCLPDIIRGGHYIHFRHFCAVMGCAHAPCKAICQYFKRLGELVVPFPILYKDTLDNLENILISNPLYRNRTYTIASVKIADLLEDYQKNKYYLEFARSEKSGYPIAKVLQAVAYIIASPDQINGKRIKGKYIELIKQFLKYNPSACVEVRKPEILTPLLLIGNGKGTMVAAYNPDVYQSLIVFDKSNPYKFSVRQISEKDLQ